MREQRLDVLVACHTSVCVLLVSVIELRKGSAHGGDLHLGVRSR